MFGWREERQFLFGAITLLLFSFFIFGLYLYLKAPNSCQNKKQDKTELGLNCGGSCSAVCPLETKPLSVVWAKAFLVSNNNYDLAALIDNPNLLFGIPELNYHFDVRNAENKIIYSRDGKTFANPNERFLAFESNIELTEKPYQVFISFPLQISFIRFSSTPPPLAVNKKNEDLQLTPKPRLSLILTNQEPTALSNLEARVVISNTENNAIAVSSTKVEKIERNDFSPIYFTWQEPFPEKPQICTEPIDTMLLFDRSGSMNDDSKDPPEPLTAAREAAQTFLSSFGKLDQVGLISFATKASNPPDQELFPTISFAKEALARVLILPTDEFGSTNMADALNIARAEFDTERRRQEARPVIVLFTDGKANYPPGKGQGELFAKKEAEEARKSGITIYTIGLGKSVNTAFLKEVAGFPNRYYAAATTEDLGRIYQEVSDAICPERTYIRDVYIRKNYAKERSD
jgi:Mg-chelatase subunit ChlD